MANDTLTDIGVAHLYTPFRSTLFNAMDKVPFTNQSGGDVVTGDVLCLDTAHDMSFIAASDTYPYRTCFVVPSNIDDLGVASVKTIVAGEMGWVYRQMAYVPLANVDEAVASGEYLAFGATSKSFTGLGITTDSCLPPVNAKAIAFKSIGAPGQIPVLLLEDTANAYMGCRVYNNADIAITASTITPLTFNAEEYDPAGMHSTDTNTERLTVPSEQVGAVPYKITGHVTWSGAPSGMYIAVRLNGADIIARMTLANTVLSASVTTQYQLSAEDYVELLVYTTTAGLSIKYYGKYSPVFAMVRAGD
jgi:hypothetical protein